MRPRLLMLCLLLAAGSAPAAQPTPIPRTVMDRAFQQLGEQFVQSGASDGLSVAVVDHGQVRYYNFGTVSREHPQAPTDQTLYEIGSISKTFTSLLLAHAVLDGKVSPDSDIRRFLPGDYPNLAWQGQPIRVRDLATTTSRLPDNLPDFGTLAVGEPAQRIPFAIGEALAGYSRTQLFTDLHGVALDGAPGSLARHSNLGAVLLGIVVEQAYGRDGDRLRQALIEQPLHMASGHDPARDAQLATGYDDDHRPMPPLRGDYIRAAGGLRYSAADLGRYLHAQLDAKDPAIRLAQTLAWGDINREAVAYNWHLDRTVDGEPRLSHTGGTFGTSSYMEFYPQSGYGVVLLANRGGSAQGRLVQLAEAALWQMRGKPAALSALEDALERSDYADVPATVAQVRQRFPGLTLGENRINTWAYALRSARRTAPALALFRYNVAQFPVSWNAWDSLGEGYETTGDLAAAVEAYQRSLAYNPANDHARDRLQALAK